MTTDNTPRVPDTPDLKPVSPDMNYIRQQRGHKDSEKRVADYHGSKWDTVNGVAMQKAKLKAKRSREASNKADRLAEKAEAEFAATDQFEIIGGRHDNA